MVLTITQDQQKMEFKLDCHSNETLLSIRHKIARKMGVSVEQISMGVTDRWLNTTENNKLIHQLEFGQHPVLITKTHMCSGYSRATDVRRGREREREEGWDEQEDPYE